MTLRVNKPCSFIFFLFCSLYSTIILFLWFRLLNASLESIIVMPLDYFLNLVDDLCLELVIKLYPMANLVELLLLHDLHPA